MAGLRLSVRLRKGDPPTHVPAAGRGVREGVLEEGHPRHPLRQEQMYLLTGRCGGLVAATPCPSGIDAFLGHGDDVPDQRELDPTHKNLMIFNDLMLSKHSTCDDYYGPGRHYKVDMLLPVPEQLQAALSSSDTGRSNRSWAQPYGPHKPQGGRKLSMPNKRVLLGLR